MKILTKKGMALLTTLLFLGLVSVPATDGRAIGVGKTKTFLRDKFDESVIYIEAPSHYDYGLRVGRQNHLQYKIINFLARFIKNCKISEKEIQDQINDMEYYCPFLLKELKGLSAGCNIKLERLVYLQMTLSNIFGRCLSNQCTVTLSSGKATKNNETFLTQNIDTKTGEISRISERILRPLITLRPKVVKINTLCYKYVYLGIPVLWEFPLMNEEGLGFGGTGLILTKNESRYIDEGQGVSTFMLERLTMMTCKNVSEVANLWKNTERASGTYREFPHHFDNSMSVWCDKEGGILVIEQTHNHIITVFGNSTDITGTKEGILWSANHHQWLDPNLTGSVFRNENLPSYIRADRARELLEENYGNITIDVCKSIVRDYKGGWDKDKRDSADICRISDEKYPSMTNFAWIIQPKSLCIYWTRGPPHRYRFIKKDLSRIFGE